MAQKKAPEFAAKYGPWALVTGASDGIGREIARDLAARGLNVMLVARREGALRQLATELESGFDVETDVYPADLSDPAAVAQLLSASATRDIGLLVANAGFGVIGTVGETDHAEELAMIDVNCRAVFALIHRLAAHLRERRRGGIVLLGSIVGFQGVPHSANYAATKAYIHTLAEGVRAELKPYGIDVLTSAPGPVATGFSARADMRMGNAADPAEVARSTVSALGRAATVRPGLQSKLLGHSLSTLPRSIRSLILGNIMKGMTRHRDAETHNAP